MADRNFDVELAKSWEKEVRQELNAVSSLLIRVESECQTDPAEDDAILVDIQEKGQMMADATKELEKQFNDAMNALSKIIVEWTKAIEEGLSKMKEWASGFHLGG